MHVTYLWREISIQEGVVLVECSQHLPKSRTDVVEDVITVIFRLGEQMFTLYVKPMMEKCCAYMTTSKP